VTKKQLFALWSRSKILGTVKLTRCRQEAQRCEQQAAIDKGWAKRVNDSFDRGGESWLLTAKALYESGNCIECCEYCLDHVNLVRFRFLFFDQVYPWHCAAEYVPFNFVATVPWSEYRRQESDETLALRAIADSKARKDKEARPKAT
jgi:hypothetical protein